MRARFTIKTKLSAEALRGVLNDLNLIPGIAEDDAVAVANREEIIEMLPSEDNTKEFVRRTFRFLVFDYTESVWGIVNEPATGVFQFRFRHDDANILFDIAHKHLERLLVIQRGAIEIAPDGAVQVFEKSGKVATMTARFIARRNTGDLIRERAQAIWSAGVTFSLGAVSTYFSHPSAFLGLKGALFFQDKVNQSYWESFSGRMATAFFVGTILAVYDIIFYVRTQQHSSRLSIKQKA